MPIPRRDLLRALGAVAVLHGSVTARASSFPDRPLRFVVPFGAGGNADAVGRLLGAAMGTQLGQSVVVENRPGAGGSLGATVVAQSPADGYTLLIGSNGPLSINPFVQSKLAYDTLKDFVPIALVGRVPHVLLLSNDVPARSVAELIALSQRQGLGCATSGIGSATHLSLERLNTRTGARLTHVPYRGGNSLVPDVVAGTVPTACMEFSTALPLHKAGKARILAIAATQRSALAADLPTFIEGGVPGFVGASYVGLVAPARTPDAVLRRLEEAANAAIGTPAMVERLQGLGLEASTPAERSRAGFTAFLQAELAEMRDAVRQARIQPE